MRVTKKLSRYVDKNYPKWDISIALRYLPIVEKIQEKARKANILDVGSGEFGITTYIPKKYEVTGTDIDFGGNRSKNLKQVKASAHKLPFKDKSFFAVVSVDTLEHLPKEIRKKSIYEMVRVADKHLCLAFPSGKSSKLVDRFIDKYYQFTHKQKLAYLDEHIKYGLPDQDEVVKEIKKAAKKRGRVIVETKGNTNIFVWLTLLLMGFSEIRFLTYFYHKLVLFTPVLKRINVFPNYRVIIYTEFI